MTRPRFLIDENVARPIVLALTRHEPTIDLLEVGEPGAPPRRTIDPDLLIAGETTGRVLVSNDRQTMPQHLADHFQAGRHTSGVVLLREGFPIASYVQDLLLIWYASEAEEWTDRTAYIPF